MTDLLCYCQSEGRCDLHGTAEQQIVAQALRIFDAHENWAWSDIGGEVFYGIRLEESVGGTWLSDDGYDFGRGIVALRVGRWYSVAEIADAVRTALGLDSESEGR